MQFPASDRFELVRRLGEGGMGVVYEARDRDSGARLALKTLRRVDAQAVYRFKNEFRALQDLEHPNLVTLGELFEIRGEWFFTMELVDGTDFLTYVRPGRRTVAFAPTAHAGGSDAPAGSAGGRLDEARLRAGFAQLARGLVALHAAGKIHRDVKPSNIRVQPDGRVVLLDFGLVAERESKRSAEAAVVGTAVYMAPEQAAGDRVGPPADWYAAGVILYEALTGRVPFAGAPLKILMDKQQREPPAPTEVAPDAPPDLGALCAELLRYEPAARPDGSAVLERLGAAPISPPSASSSSQLSQAPFVGREAELRTCSDAFDRVRAGEAATVFVHGDSGLGKSALLRHFADDVSAQTGDAVVLSGRCYERESVPYKAFDGVVDALARYLRTLSEAEVNAVTPLNAALLPRVFPVLGRVEAIAAAPIARSDARDPHELRRLAFTALRDLLGSIADRHHLIVIIDDMQWADAESELLLQELMRPPDAPVMLLLLSSRAERGRVPGPVHAVELAPLGPEVARALAKALLERAKLGGAISPSALAAEAMGHPLYIDELIRHAALTGAVEPRALRLDDAICARAQQLPEDARRLLGLVAVAGAPLPVDTLSQAARLEPSALSRQLAILRVGNFIRGAGARADAMVEPYHDRVREAIAGVLDEGARIEHHRRLAIALESSGVAADRPELLLRHLEAAGEAEKAALRAEDAAARASRSLAFDRAASLYGTALRLGAYDAARARELRVSLGDALASAGRGAEAAEVYLAAQGEADDDLRLELRRRAADNLLKTGHVSEGLRVLDDVFAQIGDPFPRSPNHALRDALRARLKLWMRRYRWTERPPRDIPPRELTRIDVHSTAAHGLGMIDTVRGAAIGARGLLLALRTGERFRAMRELFFESAFVAASGGRRLARGRKLFERLSSELSDDDDPYLHALAPMLEGALCYYEGAFARSLERLQQAQLALRERTLATAWETNVSRQFEAFTLSRTGGLRGLRQSYDRDVWDAELRGDRFTVASLTRLTRAIWLADDEPERGLCVIDEARWQPSEDRFDLQTWYDLLSRGELALYAGDFGGGIDRIRAGIRALHRSLLPRVIMPLRLDAATLLGRAALAEAAHRDRRALRDVKRCADTLDRERVGYARTWSSLLRAGTAALTGDAERAARHLRESIGAADAHGQALEAAAARRQLGALLGGDEGAALVATADTWMRGEQVAAPVRMAHFVAPGFDGDAGRNP